VKEGLTALCLVGDFVEPRKHAKLGFDGGLLSQLAGVRPRKTCVVGQAEGRQLGRGSAQAPPLRTV
jgi:hypothetical protein